MTPDPEEVVNDAIRRRLSPRPNPTQEPAYRVRPHETALRPGIDPAGFNGLADELEDEAVVGKAASGR